MVKQNELSCSNQSPFLLNRALSFKNIPLLGQRAESVIEMLFGLEKIHRLYQDLPKAKSSREFLESVFDLFQIRYKVFEGDRSNVPEKGGAIVVATHPFGALEGMILAHILHGIRSDVRILANEFLGRVP